MFLFTVLCLTAHSLGPAENVFGNLAEASSVIDPAQPALEVYCVCANTSCADSCKKSYSNQLSTAIDECSKAEECGSVHLMDGDYKFNLTESYKLDSDVEKFFKAKKISGESATLELEYNISIDFGYNFNFVDIPVKYVPTIIIIPTPVPSPEESVVAPPPEETATKTEAKPIPPPPVESPTKDEVKPTEPAKETPTAEKPTEEPVQPPVKESPTDDKPTEEPVPPPVPPPVKESPTDEPATPTAEKATPTPEPATPTPNKPDVQPAESSLVDEMAGDATTMKEDPAPPPPAPPVDPAPDGGDTNPDGGDSNPDAGDSPADPPEGGAKMLSEDSVKIDNLELSNSPQTAEKAVLDVQKLSTDIISVAATKVAVTKNLTINEGVSSTTLGSTSVHASVGGSSLSASVQATTTITFNNADNMEVHAVEGTSQIPPVSINIKQGANKPSISFSGSFADVTNAKDLTITVPKENINNDDFKLNITAPENIIEKIPIVDESGDALEANKVEKTPFRAFETTKKPLPTGAIVGIVIACVAVVVVVVVAVYFCACKEKNSSSSSSSSVSSI